MLNSNIFSNRDSLSLYWNFSSMIAGKKIRLLLIALSALGLFIISSPVRASPSLVRPGTNAPDFNLIDIKSKAAFSLSDFQGKVVILDLFATWCGPCKRAMPKIRGIYQSYSPDELTIISIDVDEAETETLVGNFILEHQMEWLVALDSNSVVFDNYEVNGIPTMYIIDRNQEIAYGDVGFYYDDIIYALEQTLALKPIKPLPDYSSEAIPSIEYIFWLALLGMICVGISMLSHFHSQRKKQRQQPTK